MSTSAIAKYRYVVPFYALSTIIPWAFWFVAAYLSHITPRTEYLGITITILLIAGLCAPAIIAFYMIESDPSLSHDLRNRVFNFRNVRPIYLFLTCFLMLGSIILAQLISLFFGGSLDQFTLAKTSSFAGGVLTGWFWIVFAPIVEELAWHSYGTDSLRARMNLLYTCLLFAVYWAIWHFPSFLIEGYYQSNLEQLGFIYSLNFMFSIFPFVILMNWLYYKTNRNILVAIVFHISANYFNEFFNTSPDSKFIQTIILTILAVIVILWEKPFFLEKKYHESH